MYDKNFHLIQKHKVSLISWVDEIYFLYKYKELHILSCEMVSFFVFLLFFPPPSGDNTNSSRMCGVLLHVEKVGALRLFRAAESVWEEKV